MMELDDIYDNSCSKCDLCKTANYVCVGHRGSLTDVELVVCGEAPGTDEDVKGVPFIGKAGVLLDKLLAVAGVDKKKVLYTNIVRCFPNENGITRQPTKQEIEPCIDYLYQTLDRIRLNFEKNKKNGTRYIVALGNEALEALTGNRKISTNRGKEFNLVVHRNYKEKYGHLENEFTVVGVIHPSAVLRGLSVAEKQIVTDLRALWMKIVGKQNMYWKKYKWENTTSGFDMYVDGVINAYKSGYIPFVAFDLETTGLIPYDKDSRIVAFSFSHKPGEGVVVPWIHKDSPWNEDGISQESIKNSLKKLLSEVPICGWNLLFDVKWLSLHLGIEVKEIGFDGFLARRWMWGDTLPYNDLNKVAEEELQFHGHGQDIWNILSDTKGHMGMVDSDILVRYAGGDADASYQLCVQYLGTIKQMRLLDQFKNISLRAVLPIASMEMSGVFIDQEMNKKLQKEFPEQMQPIIDSIKNTKWGIDTQKVLSQREKPLTFNLDSSTTLRELVYGQMKMPAIKSGKQGPSTDKEVTEELLDYCSQHGLQNHLQVLQWLSEWRGLKHTYNNFIKNLSEYTQWDGYFHTNYHIAGTDTGRVSSSKPSLHGQPKGSKARWQFISRWADKGGVILSSDMSQAEMRVLASLSRDENLIQTILSGVDIHTANAAKMFKVPVEEVTKKQRDLSKRAGFGVVYGIGAQTLAGRIETSVEEAQGIIDSWYEAFPKTLLWQQEQYRNAKKHGFLITVYGRIRHIEDYNKSHWGDKAWRRSINFPIQSTASDITFSALLEAVEEVKRLGLKSKIFGFIHDAIVTDVYPGELLTIVKIMKNKMVSWTNTVNRWILAPMEADYEVGASWGTPCRVNNFNTKEIEVTGDAANALKLKWLLEKTFTVDKLEDSEKDGKITTRMKFLL